VSDRRWTFDGDGAAFRLASEARRMKWAHLADPFAAVDTSNIEPYPHQIDAVYNRFLEQKPLRFLLADGTAIDTFDLGWWPVFNVADAACRVPSTNDLLP
jgi:hypothetical protein